MLTLTGSRISGARARAISSVKTICSFSVASRPPYSRGHWMPTQPPAARSRCHACWNRRRSTSSSGGGVDGRCAASQRRSSARNVATILGEVSCAAVFFVRESMVMTGELSVRYLKPCPVERPLAAVARATGEHPRYAVVDAELRDGDVVLARSTGKFFYHSRPEP